jgi:glycosyltransferase involved in cell wall biosynthesis
MEGGCKMRVGIVIDVDYPHVGEIRPTKLARSLHQAGHQVVFICSNSRQRPAVQDLDYGRVYRFAFFVSSRMFQLLSAASPLNPLWATWISRIARKEALDVLISSNIRIALPTIVAGRLLHKPVVLDLQENNREVVRVYPKTRPHHHITKNSGVVGFLEDLCVELADHTWIVIEERLEAIPRRLRRPGRITVVCHTPTIEELQASQAVPPKTPTDKFTLIYFGLFAPGVGSVEPILSAMPHVLERDKNIRFLIAGKGHEYLVPMVEKLQLSDYVRFTGLIQPAHLPVWLQQGDLGIIAYPVSLFSNTTISNKLFHYMAAGLPVLSTDMTPTRRILNEVGCGRTFPKDASSQDIAQIILQLKSSAKDLAEMGDRGRHAVLEKYNWSVDFGHALASLKQLVCTDATHRNPDQTAAIKDDLLDSQS